MHRCVGCWVWGGYRNRGGYGFTRVGGRGAPGKLAHRLSWELHRGPIPNGLHVLHRCDNPSCVRPDHLFLGTNQENIADRIAKGRPGGMNSPGARRLIGDANPRTRYPDELVVAIASLRANGALPRAIAEATGLRRQTVSALLYRRAVCR